MKVKKILLTSDDGYNSLGIRILVHFLKNKYQLLIAGTRDQQSGVGGKMSINEGFKWKEAVVDGVKAYCVDGTPADAAELIGSYFFEDFDLIISGINWGANLGSTIVGSGTINAALRALGLELAPQAITISWDLPREFYSIRHQDGQKINSYLDYPGETINKLIELAINNDFWRAELLNINLPKEPASQIKFTKQFNNIKQIFDHSIYEREGPQNPYQFKSSRVYNKKIDPNYDVRAVSDGFISISPMKTDFINNEIYNKVKDLKVDF